MLIDGFGITGYRSFGEDLSAVGPFGKVNLFVGKNNSGKSNILQFLQHQFPGILAAIWSGSGFPEFRDTDRHLGRVSERETFLLARRVEGAYGRWLKKLDEQMRGAGARDGLSKLIESGFLSRGTDALWFGFDLAGTSKCRLSPKWAVKATELLQKSEWVRLWGFLTGGQGGTPANLATANLDALAKGESMPSVTVKFIPAIREVRKTDPESQPSSETREGASLSDSDLAGAGLIARLHIFQQPDHFEEHLLSRFEAVNALLQDVLNDQNVELQIPASESTINVRKEGKLLPLKSVGTGIHELIILAAGATVLENTVLCIEEPEIHLHPLLQRKLLRYLHDNTTNQYFIATHSAHFLDFDDAAAFHVELEEGQSKVRPVGTDRERSAVCADLGYRASDLVQANSVIWVEGPSDRIYLKHWLSALDGRLREGTHYSIMFYGGRLLKHLTALEQEVDDFISLARLNRYFVVLMDADRIKAREQLNDTKTRVKSEVEDCGGLAWVTKGRSIENYVESSLLEAAVKKVHSDVVRSGREPYSEWLLKAQRPGRRRRPIDKVKVAREVVKQDARLQVLDLAQMLRRLDRFICEANDLESVG